MSEKLTRQQIYDRIRATSKDSFILKEMQRLGFWDSSGAPSLSEALIEKEANLNQELTKLLEQNRKYSDQEAMLKEMRKARMKQAKEKREQTKQKNKQKRLDKAEKWKQTQLEQIIYLGKGVSGGLGYIESDTERLKKFNLPVFHSAGDLAASMQLDLASLRYLLFQRKVSRTSHYHVFELPKKSGGKRRISAPKTRLKNLQNWLLENVLTNISTQDAAHGFIRQRSILTNAQPHLGKDIVVNLDLKDFFPTIHYSRVKGLFKRFGYSEQVSTILALISTQPETEEVEMDGVRYYVQKGNRFLPQGSPASPAISNLIAWTLDKKVQGLATKLNFTYTRYADDLSFSTAKENEKNISKLLYFVKKIIESEGFTLHPEKTHIMRNGGLKKVTGIVVNEKLNVERNQLRKFRALLHNIETNGWKEQKWGKAIHLVNAVKGYICYVQMVNPQKAASFKEQLSRIIARHGEPVIEKIAPVTKALPEKESAGSESQQSSQEQKTLPSGQTDWWNIFL